MAKYIDADALLNNTDGLDHVKYSQEYGHVVPVCDIVYAPTVDAVEVVRCKDCKHNSGSCCDYSAVYTRPNGYCQWGERRE